MSKVEMRVRSMVESHFGTCARDLGRTMDLVEQLAADSLDIVALMIRLEDEFEIGVSESDLESMRTIQDIALLVNSRAGSQQAHEQVMSG